ncbi:MAG: SurA N-terminal domain-containing protein, partial [Hyphomicrobiaceae bacterium]
MLDALRRGAGSWVAKVFLFVLVISFAVWGVADVFRGYGQGALARIGNFEISTDEFRQAYQREIDNLGRRIGQRLTPEQARAFALDRYVLLQLIGMAAIESHANKLGLRLSDEAIVDGVQRSAAFQ